MAPNLLGSSPSDMFLGEGSSAEPIQIIQTKKGAQYDSLQSIPKSRAPVKRDKPLYQWEIVWRNVLAFVYLHMFAIYGLYLFLFNCYWKTSFFALFLLVLSGHGVTAGAHRLWAHRTYKAKLPLRIFLAMCQTIAFQNHLYEWVRDHRVHHKFTDTDADPHNAKRGFFFSHIGWLMVKKHKDVFVKGKTVDLSDLEADPVVRFQRKFYLLLVALFCFAIPTLVPWYFWNENIYTAWYICAIGRYTFALNGTWSVNSAAHIWGNKPYDKSIGPTENKFVSAFAFGEGWHNYHHVFPWDYKAAELGNYKLNFTTGFLDLMGYIGQAYDLKTVSEDMVMKRVKRTGDGTRKFQHETNDEDDHHHHPDDMIWGWGDKDMKQEEIREVEMFNNIKHE